METKNDEEKMLIILGSFLDNYKQSKFERIGISIRGERDPPRIVCMHLCINTCICIYVSMHKHMKQNSLAEGKPRIEMGNMADDSPALLTATPLCFLEWVGCFSLGIILPCCICIGI